MAIEIGLLILSAIVGSIIGVGVLILSIFLFYWLSVAKSKVFTTAPLTVQQEVKSTLLPYKEVARRFSIPDPSTSFDMDSREMLLPQNQQVSITVHQTESPARSHHTNDSLTHDSDEPVVIHHVIKPFVPKRKDDLALNTGDQVTISMTFTDGMGHGVNVTTGYSGMFPLNCISALQAGSASPHGSSGLTTPTIEFPPLVPEGEGKLLFSMVNPDEALEIINASMSPERRKQYFDSLLKNGPNDTPSSSNNSLNNEGAEEGRGSRASKNWSRLRVGWKDAVKAELKSSYESWEACRNRHAFWRMMAENYKI